MYTVGQIAKKFLISRSTLLYYDSIGLLKPSGRSGANYRLYSEEDLKKMERIALYRETGIPLKIIAGVLEKSDTNTPILENRLSTINKEIQNLRTQQKIILQLLKSENTEIPSRVITKDQWVSLLKAAGLDEDAMALWHIEFEQLAPEAHQDFLESLGVQESEIKSIRKLSKNKP